MQNEAAILSEYVKIIKTGEIALWAAFKPGRYVDDEQVDVVLPSGERRTFRRNEVKVLTPNEIADHLQKMTVNQVKP